MMARRIQVIATIGSLIAIASSLTGRGDIVVPVLAIVLVPTLLVCAWVRTLNDQSGLRKSRRVAFAISLGCVTVLHVVALVEWGILLIYKFPAPIGSHRGLLLAVLGIYCMSVLFALAGQGWQRVSLAVAGYCSAWAFILPLVLD